MVYNFKYANLQDEVKHKLNDTTGIVIAKFEKDIDGEMMMFFDVRGEDKIYYQTPAANWSVVAKEDQ